MGLQPTRKMVGIIGERAHVRDPNVKQIAWIRSRIGEATAEIGTPLDEDDLCLTAHRAHKIDRSDHAACSASDYGNPAGSSAHSLIQSQFFSTAKFQGRL